MACKLVLLALVTLLLGGFMMTGCAERVGPWELERLYQTPRVFPAPGFEEAGVRALWYEGLPFTGHPTRVFAWYGVPETKPGERVPAVVCVHGGGGTAYADWVRWWVDHGYAAIAMDLEGGANSEGRFKNRWSGPPNAGYGDIDQPVEDQWMYHAVADVALAHSLIRSFPEIDPERIGVAGISWGGVITANVMGVDTRFRFAIPTYGCGFQMDCTPAFQSFFKRYEGTPKYEEMLQWDGSTYLHRAKLPALWVSGPDDFAFSLKAREESADAQRGPNWFLIPVGFAHGHYVGWQVEEMAQFADSIVKKGVPFPAVEPPVRQGDMLSVEFKSKLPIVKAEFCFTTDLAEYPALKKWEAVPAPLAEDGKSASATIPEGALAYYFTLTDEAGRRISSRHLEVPAPAVATVPGGEGLDLWVLAGQSNMVGAAAMREPGPTSDRIKLFNLDNTWIEGREPLHRLFEAEAPVFKQLFLTKNVGVTEEQFDQYRALSQKTPLGTVGPGLFFARQLVKHTDQKIGLLPSAYGATSLADWDPARKDEGGDSLYGAMIERIALAGGNLKGVLWYQGESDAMLGATGYDERFLHFVECVRRDTGRPNLPFLYVQIGRYALDYSPQAKEWELLRELQRRAASSVPNLYMVSAIDLPLGDSIHLSYEGQERLGKRLAEVALTNVYGVKDHGSPIDLQSAEVIDPVGAMGRIRVTFSGVSGGLRAAGLVSGFKLLNQAPDLGGPAIFRADLDPEAPDSVILWHYPCLTQPASLYYGPGLDPYCNLVDEKDMAVPAFGPVELLPAATT